MRKVLIKKNKSAFGFLMVVLSSILFAEKSEIYLYGGVTFASICYDDNFLQSNVDMSARTGFNFGIDMTEKNFKGGIGFTQFGSNFDLSSLDESLRSIPAAGMMP